MPVTKKKTAAKKQSSSVKKEEETVEQKEEEVVKNAFKPKVRNEYNLFDDIEYEFDELGRVNWKKLVPKEQISANYERLADAGIDFNDLSKEDIHNLDEQNQLILLQGFKDVADLRGYVSLQEETAFQSSAKGVEKAVTHCSITWIGVPETNMFPITVTTVGEAHFHNTLGFGKNYLARMSANRAFIANVKQTLRIPIYGKDELGGNNNNQEHGEYASGGPESASPAPSGFTPSPQPWAAVKDFYEKHGHSFDNIKTRLYEKYPETVNCKSFKDLSKFPKVLQSLKQSLDQKLKEKEDHKPE